MKLLFKKIKHLIYKFRRLLLNKKYADLGSDTRSPYFLTIDLSTGADITLDITKPLENNLHNKFDFIWSERLLEHIDYQKISIVFENIYKMLKINGFCRFSLPVCYSKLNTDMMRANNMQKSASMGHITWFTYEGFGEVREELFGISYPPNDNLITWEETIDKNKLDIRLIRFFDKLNNLNIDENIYDSKLNKFKDIKEINMKRPNSFVFDLVKLC
tara:strand:- start:32 stop:679 length:648 start_codon:yes stop_codon:yes gene_type:complete